MFTQKNLSFFKLKIHVQIYFLNKNLRKKTGMQTVRM